MRAHLPPFRASARRSRTATESGPYLDPHPNRSPGRDASPQASVRKTRTATESGPYLGTTYLGTTYLGNPTFNPQPSNSRPPRHLTAFRPPAMSHISIQTVLAGALLCLSPLLAPAAIPEPPAILYGTLPASAGNAPTVRWTLTGNSEALTLPAAQIVSINGTTYYVATVPFETRRLADNTPIAATPATLALPPANVTYTRSVTLNGAPFTLAANQQTFVYGAPSQGRMERLDLSTVETFAAWSQRLFGTLVSPTADADGDGLDNNGEFLAGTDPRDPLSRLAIKSFTPRAGGGFLITWDSVASVQYQVERSTDLATWSLIASDLPGTNAPLTFTDPSPPTSARLFYRVRTQGQ